MSARQLGAIIGSAIGALILSVIGIFSVRTVDDADRYRAREAARDFAAISARIDRLERRLDAHADLDWHPGAGESLSELRAILDAHYREHEWVRRPEEF